MKMKETMQVTGNNTSTTAESAFHMMSLFDYLGRPAGGDLGRQVYNKAVEKGVPTSIRQVSNKKYTGKIILYPRYFLEQYFSVNKIEKIKLPF
jgi:hypothetical protein